MDKVQAGPSTVDVRTAQTNLANAQATLNKAQSDLDTLNKGASPADVRAAQTAVTTAQTDLDKAQGQVDLLNKGPDAAAIAVAEREVQRAQVSLQVAQAARVDANTTQTQHEAAVANAKLNLQDAQDKLTAVKSPAPPDQATMAIANRNLQTAQTALDLAKQNLVAVKKGPDQATLDAAQHAVDNAQAVVDNTQDRLDELMSHPTPQELRDAQDRVTQAQKDVSNAQKPVQVSAPVDDGSAQFNIQLLQKATATDQADVDSLQKQLEATRLQAPFAGVVTNVAVKAGDAVDPTRAVVTLSTGSAPVVNIDLTDQDAAKIKQGQKAHVVLDTDGTTVDAALTSVAPNQAAGVGKTATLQISWPKDPPAIGTTAQVSIVVQRKDGVLLVPKKAVRSAGSRRFVQYMSGSTRKVANVEVGITTSDTVEIVSGLTEGQVVVVGP
jgi:RND family efflux transporter MFP subunit